MVIKNECNLNILDRMSCNNIFLYKKYLIREKEQIQCRPEKFKKKVKFREHYGKKFMLKIGSITGKINIKIGSITEKKMMRKMKNCQPVSNKNI